MIYKEEFDRYVDECRSEMIPCRNKKCNHWDKIEPYGCGGECNGETAIASCSVYIPNLD